MNEFDLLRGLRADVPAPTPARLTAGRERLLASIAAPSTGWKVPRRASRRPIVRFAIPGAAAAAALGAAIWLVSTPATRPNGAPAPVRVSLADQVLSSAAQRTASRPAIAPRPGQWIYTRLVSYSLGAGRTTSVSWSRFDGREQAYTQSGALIVHHTPVPPSNGHSALTRFLRTPTVGTAYRALASLPPEPHRLLQAVATEASPSSVSGSGWDPARGHATRAQLEFGVLADLLWNGAQAGPPQAEANVFHAMARIPGVHARRGVTAATGRPAIALWISGVEQQLLLDPTTFSVTGQRTLSDGHWPPPPRSGRSTIPSGRVVESLAWARIQFVARPGQR